MDVGDKIFVYCMIIIFGTLFLVTVLPILFQAAFGQSNETVTVIQPTPTLTPTPTAPNPNFQYLPQKAYVIPFAPENGIPQTAIPLQSINPVIQPTQQQQPASNNILDQFGGVAGILAMAGAAGVYVKTHLMNKVVKENAVQIVKGTEVDQSLAKQVFENMPDKGNNINDKPEIKLETLKDNKDEATETAAKA